MNQLLVGECIDDVENDQRNANEQKGGNAHNCIVDNKFYILCFYTKENGVRYYIDPTQYAGYDAIMKMHPEYENLPKVAFCKHPWNAKKYISAISADEDFRKLKLYDERARKHNFNTNHASHYFARQMTLIELDIIKDEYETRMKMSA